MLECTDIAFLTLDDEDALWGQQLVEDVIARTPNACVKEAAVNRRVGS
ncbi:2-dehydro-3-deoxygluconokinase [Escherichia coli]|nr:2-dehydro-3-deoxygluconokinase [Escherichia coli]